MKNLTKQICVKQHWSVVFGKVGHCLKWAMCLTTVASIVTGILRFFGKVQFLPALNIIVGSTGVAIVLYLLSELCFQTEAKLRGEVQELERSRDGLQ